MNKKFICISVVTALSLPAHVLAGNELTLEALNAKLEALSQENTTLRNRVEQLEASNTQQTSQTDSTTIATIPTAQAGQGVIQFNNKYSYDVLDPTTNISRQQKLILKNRQSGTLDKNTVTLGGAATAIVDYQKSNTESKFGYLMRHPTASNQRTKEASEAVIHSAQVGITATMGDWTTAYMELLYNPEQSFGSGTITDLNRNQVQVRRAYVLFGNLDKSPLYASVGKMTTPFGLTDTVNPFTSSTVWHAFGGLAYGVSGGYSNNGWDLNLMGVQGGAQFRSGNVPVDESNVPSKLNNYVVDMSYTFDLNNNADLLLGASYIKGSAYCQSFPVTHFSSCLEENGAYDLYTKYNSDSWTVIAEFAQTESEWPGTFNPTIPQFGASKVTSFDVGAKYKSSLNGYKVDYSADFSRFIAGPNGSPWEKQDQYVFGIAGYLTNSVKLFGEYIHTAGYAPLNFISGGGSFPDGVTHSDADAQSDVLVFGANVAF